mmetsp:Transcript_14089/g.26351  ORF Transcript_14089/g.26351 Transcript_14089/m.26351 type:complete len:207 (-) Transcript_14089:112-732(-)
MSFSRASFPWRSFSSSLFSYNAYKPNAPNMAPKNIQGPYLSMKDGPMFLFCITISISSTALSMASPYLPFFRKGRMFSIMFSTRTSESFSFTPLPVEMCTARSVMARNTTTPFSDCLSPTPHVVCSDSANRLASLSIWLSSTDMDCTTAIPNCNWDLSSTSMILPSMTSLMSLFKTFSGSHMTDLLTPFRPHKSGLCIGFGMSTRV